MGLYNTTQQTSVTIGGVTFTSQVTNTGNGTTNRARACAAGKGGVSLTVRTSGTAGTLTVPTGFVATGARIDLYNPADGTMVVGLTAGTVVTGSPTDTVPVTTGNGAALPAAGTTNLVVSIPVSEDYVLSGNNILNLGALSAASVPGVVTYTQTDNTFLAYAPLLSVNGYAYVWASGSGIVNPLAGAAVGKVWFSAFPTDATQTYNVQANSMVL